MRRAPGTDRPQRRLAPSPRCAPRCYPGRRRLPFVINDDIRGVEQQRGGVAAVPPRTRQVLVGFNNAPSTRGARRGERQR